MRGVSVPLATRPSRRASVSSCDSNCSRKACVSDVVEARAEGGSDLAAAARAAAAAARAAAGLDSAAAGSDSGAAAEVMADWGMWEEGSEAASVD